MPEGDFRDVQRTTVEDAARWFGGDVHKNFTICTLGIVGEAGEFADIVKKVARGSLSLEDMDVQEKLRNELTDVFVYVIQTAELLNFDILERYFTHHRPLNELRFGSKNGEH